MTGDYCMVISVLCDLIQGSVDVHILGNEHNAWYATESRNSSRLFIILTKHFLVLPLFAAPFFASEK